MIQKLKIAGIIAGPLLVIACFIFKDELIALGKAFPPCESYRMLKIYCTGCGNTRSVICLLNGDIIGSVRNNIAPLLIAVLLFCLYIELIFSAMGKNVKILPRKGIFWAILLTCIFIFYILRNFIDVLAPIS